MTDAEHAEIVELERGGKLLVGVDRQIARRLFTNVPVAKIAAVTGYAPYFEKSLVFSVFLLGPSALVGSIAVAFIGFGWWGLVAVAVLPILFALYQASSPRGGAGPYAISALLVISILIYAFGASVPPAVMWPVLLFVFSLWCARMVYVFATAFYRDLALRNARLFDLLSEGISLRRLT